MIDHKISVLFLVWQENEPILQFFHLVAVSPFLPGSSAPHLFFFLMSMVVSVCLCPPPVDGPMMGSSGLLIVWSSRDTKLCPSMPKLSVVTTSKEETAESRWRQHLQLNEEQ